MSRRSPLRRRRELRIAFALLAAALLVPAALLVQRALLGVAAEQEARHRAVAERVFDEMERALSELVAREEARPIGAWRAGDVERLRALPDEPFVLGYFQLEPDGRLTTPLPARDEVALRAAAAALAARDGRERAERQRRLLAPPSEEVRAFARDERLQDFAAADEADAAPAPSAAPPRVAVDPLVGRLAGGGTLLLHRTVFTGDGALRQGLALDLDGLGDWLRGRGVERVPGATLAFAAAPAPAADAAYRYRHRFAEPFDALSASLALAPLGGAAGAGTLYALSALLALTATAGLSALYRTAALALAVAERRSQFAAAVTHELRTPVTAIRLYGEMLRDDLVPTEEKRRECYRTISAESERLGRLVDDVLELARLEKGARPIPLAAAPLAPVVEEALELLRPQAERAGFALRNAVEPGLPRVRFHRDALLQVLANLVDNALKYARDAREREIDVACRRAGGRVWLCVRDHGPGVAMREIPLLFEPFQRGADERVRATRGTGLGLALVRRLVEGMGGDVEGGNAPGGGFEVRVSLPAATG